MFMTPNELLGGGYVHGSVDQAGGTMGDLVRQKVANAKSGSAYDDDGKRTEGSLYEQIERHGVQKPVVLTPYESDSVSSYNRGGKPGTFILGNGNHRVSSAAAISAARGRDMYVPVVHDEDYMGGKARGVFGVSHW